MPEILDETLMMFADGTLPRDEHDRIASLVKTDPVLEQRLQPFLAIGKLDVFDDMLKAPIPDRLLDTIYATPIKGLAPARGAPSPGHKERGRIGSAIRSWTEWLQPLGQAGWRQAAIASTVLVLAGSSALLVHGWSRSPATGKSGLIVADGGRLLAKGELQTTLETVMSRPRTKSDVEGGSGWRVRPVNTFRSRDQEFCRQFEMIGGAPKWREVGFACRTGDAKWQVRANATVRDIPAVADSRNFEAADAEVLPPSLDQAFRELRAGDLLGRDGEQAAFASHWQNK